MKKILLIICFYSEMVFGAGFIFIEPKIGITPYQNFQSRTESETLNDFFDYGSDIYFPIPKMTGFDIGIGAEIRRIHPLLSNKKNVGLFFTLLKLPTFLDTKIVSRIGFLQNITLKKTFYYAFGIEKSIHRLVFQVLFDDMQINDSNMNSHYRSVVFKMGVKI
ncbi:hypothetical protein BKH42_02540 [Helicobacter sp. 13S00482-2]|uniref:hypothetical protein n=1 Tax=Helicobacter sp. 13S00482-2 TaxID=1476200 RepID=UPI000BA4FB22|nr:hypothetical protein [Helicobacter sp. 13S00482-2]PAF54109.1 hypothetical protein BKH42_02540 [Helicobacter sp. 13S00482-2]